MRIGRIEILPVIDGAGHELAAEVLRRPGVDDPVAASAVRNALADEVADSADLVVGGHFPGLRFGRVITASGNRTFRAI
jgi:hypothetical protein